MVNGFMLHFSEKYHLMSNGQTRVSLQCMLCVNDAVHTLYVLTSSAWKFPKG